MHSLDLQSGHMLEVHKGQRLWWNGKKWPQYRDEIRRFAKLIHKEGVTSYLEIGLHRGFTFRYIGLCLPRAARMVGVEWPAAVGGCSDGVPDINSATDDLRSAGRSVHIIWGDSRASAVISEVKAFGPFDCVFIDGDHSMDAVRSDWENYGQMSRIVVFHDIHAGRNPRMPIERAAMFGVPQLWIELKNGYRHTEIIGKELGVGIGVLWTS